MYRLPAAAIAAALLIASPAIVFADTYIVDPVHSTANFAVVHLGLSRVRGMIPITSASADVPLGADVPTAVSADLQIAGIKTNNDDRDSDLRSHDWFDVTTYPKMSFTSTKISKGSDPSSFTVEGLLTMHGVTKPISFAGHLDGKTRDGKGNQRIGYTLTGKLDRRDWNVNFEGSIPGGNLVVGNDIDIVVEIEAVKTPAAGHHEAH